MIKERVDLLVELLRELREDQLAGQSIPPSAFDALLPIVPMPVLELLVFRSCPKEKKVEILLVQRPNNVIYPNQWQCPGAFICAGDTLAMTAQRARMRKMGGAKITNLEFLTFQLYTDPHRYNATILRVVHVAQIAEETPPTGQYFELYPNRNLPENLVWEQSMLIDLFPIHRDE